MNSSDDGKKADKKNESRKVIDLSERISAREAAKNPAKDTLDKLKSIKVRLDLEQAKIAIPASLLSILVVVTLANSKLLNSPEVIESRELASQGGTLIQPARGLASVPSGTSTGEDELVQEMARKTLSEITAVGRAPTALEKLSLETLEGKYAIRMDAAQKISQIEISKDQAGQPVGFDEKFIENHRAWMPVSFEKSLRIGSRGNDSGGSHQTFHLVNKLSMPVARIEVDLDSSGRLLAMKVVPTEAAGH